MPREDWIRESNLIEGVDDPKEDARSRRAWRWLSMHNPPITLEMVLTLHRKIMRIKLGTKAGKLRSEWVRVGERLCPSPESVPSLLDTWLKNWGHFPNCDAKTAHIAFEQIHPFIDGNGRVGRMLMNFQRTTQGFVPIVIKADERWKYYKWFEESPNA